MQPAAEPANTVKRPQWSITIKVVIGVIMVLIVGLALARFKVVFAPLIIGGIIAYILQPVVTWMERHLRFPRGLATGLLFLILLALLVPIGYALTPFIIRQLNFLSVELLDFIHYMQELSPDTTTVILGFEIGVRTLVDQITSALTDTVTTVAPGTLTLALGVAETVLMIIFTLLIGFYLTKDAEKIIEWFKGLIPPGYDEDANMLLEEIDKVWSAFFRGQVTLAFTIGLLITGVSYIIGLPQPLLMGILAGLMEFLPSIGHAIWLVTAVILALLEGSSTLPVSNFVFALIVAGIQFGYTQTDLNYLIPRIIGREINLHPMVVIIGIIIGASVGGVLGVALAAPTIATLRILFRYLYAMLFDLAPFPMVGAPSAPAAERQSEADRLAEETATPPELPKPRIIMHLQKKRTQQEADQTAEANPSTAQTDQEETKDE